MVTFLPFASSKMILSAIPRLLNATIRFAGRRKADEVARQFRVHLTHELDPLRGRLGRLVWFAGLTPGRAPRRRAPFSLAPGLLRLLILALLRLSLDGRVLFRHGPRGHGLQPWLSRTRR